MYITQMIKHLQAFVVTLIKRVHCNSLGQPGMFGREEFEQLAPVVDGFSLMTYDYSSAARSVLAGSCV